MSTAPGRRRLTQRVEYEVPVRGPRFKSPALATQLALVTILVGVAAAAVCATAIVAVDVPTWVHRPAAAVLLVVLCVALTNRVGGHLRIWGLVGGATALIAAATQFAPLVAGAAGMTAVLAAVLAVMITRPAETVLGVLGEVAISMGVALVGLVGVAAWNAHVNPDRFGLLVVTSAMALAIGTVWSLGAGLHGVSRVQVAVVAAVAAMLVLVIAYAAVVRTHGSPMLVDAISDVVLWLRQHIGGVPRPVEVFIGLPALIVGVALRSRRREGWWVQVFAVIGTALITSALVSPAAFPSYIGLSIVYSAVLGIPLGLLARHFVAGSRGARAARSIEHQVRNEPGRLAPLK